MCGTMNYMLHTVHNIPEVQCEELKRTDIGLAGYYGQLDNNYI